ncbi:hypothetical protein E2C01_049279 [Portunus trituberculatus]|uniref:Uncharacterized protein n=1 Tax=Portunus trituberculatus TaxID=210409 RepID=A0A5B7GCQ1_PORTR|nr:hypothetical protein [Portunus trituberculatus]
MFGGEGGEVLRSDGEVEAAYVWQCSGVVQVSRQSSHVAVHLLPAATHCLATLINEIVKSQK